jgi:aminoglycoside/choline kinase family phosphotransferase
LAASAAFGQGKKVDSRLDALKSWVGDELKLDNSRIEPASADASFRRYFRVHGSPHNLIVMDAPPGKEDLQPFLQVAQLLFEVGVNVPRVLARDLERGFLLLSDLGSRQYLDALKAGKRVEALYGDALAALARMQSSGREPARKLPPYDRALLEREMALMPEWFLTRHLGIEVTADERVMLASVCDALVRSAGEQPATFVHRDYHSRNLMVCDAGNPGILDFQDAVYGPITYDLVSLLKDCYIAWPPAQVSVWALDFRQRLLKTGAPAGRDETEFLRWFDLMGLQRHLKVLGIFARLWYRDGKRGYLADLPLVLRYVGETAQRYPQTREFAAFVERRIVPAFAAAQAREAVPA